MNNSRFHSKKCNLNKCNKLTHFITLILIISYSNLKTQSKDPFQINQLSQSESVPVSYTHLTLPTSDLV